MAEDEKVTVQQLIGNPNKLVYEIARVAIEVDNPIFPKLNTLTCFKIAAAQLIAGMTDETFKVIQDNLVQAIEEKKIIEGNEDYATWVLTAIQIAAYQRGFIGEPPVTPEDYPTFSPFKTT